MELRSEWKELIVAEIGQASFDRIVKQATDRYRSEQVYPLEVNVFRALEMAPSQVKVVILGQDPYHGVGQANGLAFSVNKGVVLPPSLRNIYKELHDDLGVMIPGHGDLTCWAKQGVLLLNATLSVGAGKALSHRDVGWEELTDAIIRIVDRMSQPIVFILWGNDARKKKKFISNTKHYIIESAHPSPLSAYRGFFGSKPFSKTNDFLAENNLEVINWEVGD